MYRILVVICDVVNVLPASENLNGRYATFKILGGNGAAADRLNGKQCAISHEAKAEDVKTKSVVCVAELFVVLLSTTSANTVAVLLICPDLVGVTTIVTVAVALGAMVPKRHVIARLQVPWLGLTETKETSAGS